MRKLLFVCGILSALFTVFHIGFWWIFDWPARLSYMTAEHRMLMQTFNFCMLPFFFFSTYAYLVLRDELLATKVGRAAIALNVGIYLFRAAAELLFGEIRTGESQFFFVLTLATGILFGNPLIHFFRGEERYTKKIGRTINN